jgi:hypothetical protein
MSPFDSLASHARNRDQFSLHQQLFAIFRENLIVRSNY